MLQTTEYLNLPLLNGIQGNILKSHGRHHTVNLFIIGDENQQDLVKAWVKSLTQGPNPIIRSCADQLASNLSWKNEKKDSGMFACLHISAAGYRYLFGDKGADRFEEEVFKAGMSKSRLNDPPLENWEEGFLESPHFMLLLAHVSEDKIRAQAVEIQKSIMFFTKVATVEKGHALFNKMGAGIEHFGYVDGISQPLFFEDEWELYKRDNQIHSENDIKFDPRAKPDLVLLKDPFIDDESAMGSYFVFRKLEQNVRAFKEAEEVLASQLGLLGEEKERAGAMLVGRFEDGTPVEEKGEAGLPNNAQFNNFSYTHGEARCPFHAHIRKTNPRSDAIEGIQDFRDHRMARRGIPFGIRHDDPGDGRIDNKPEFGVGLLFMSYQASLAKQFETIQKSWANDFNKPFAGSGIDLIIGQGGQKYPVKWQKSNANALMKSASFGQYVQMKGGEYFFAPSMRFLEEIDELNIEALPHQAKTSSERDTL